MSKYNVLNGHTLVYRIAGSSYMFGVLAGKPQLGGYDPLSGPVYVGRMDSLKPATLADFEFFRVSPRGHLSEVA